METTLVKKGASIGSGATILCQRRHRGKRHGGRGQRGHERRSGVRRGGGKPGAASFASSPATSTLSPALPLRLAGDGISTATL